MRRVKHNPLTRLMSRIWRPFTHGYRFLGFLIAVFTILSGSIFVSDLIKNPELTWEEKIKKALSLSSLSLLESGTKEINNIQIVEEDKSTFDCSNLDSDWVSGSGLRFEERKIKLQPGKLAGAAFLRNPISIFFNFELNLRSVLKSGINTNLSFYNSQGELRYAIGDGDFNTVRQMFIDNAGYVRTMEVTKLEVPIDNTYDVGLKISVVEKTDSRVAIATLTYRDSLGKTHTRDLENLIIPKSQQLYHNVGLGINASLELYNLENAHMEIKTCKIKEVSASELLNI
ncbi:MAG: hypothetical protein WD712_03150 [Candidatus Spechtbacterales bacterium]